jgi:hypothetical protein
MPTLAELQRRFSGLLDSNAECADAIAIYRNAIRGNYRNALAATYPVVRQLTGAAFFDALVDAFTGRHPASSGDLNVYGSVLGDFIAQYPHARALPYLADVARLEWAIDEAHRAADYPGAPADLLRALAAATPEAVALRFELHPSCRLLHAPFPILRIWQAHQAASATHAGLADIDFDGVDDHLLVRREHESVVIERMTRADYRWLSALAEGEALAAALERAIATDAAFDLRVTLQRRIANGTLVGVIPDR